MTHQKTLRVVLTLVSTAALAGAAGFGFRQSSSAESAGQAETQAPVVQEHSLLPALANAPMVRVSSRDTTSLAGVVRPGRLVHMVTPLYPPAAVQAHITGMVTIDARIGKDGRILQAKVISGPLALRRVAQSAVKRWRYEPTLLNGEPIERVAQVDLRFVLSAN